MPFMPQFVKVSKWKQTPTNIVINIPSYGTAPQNVDVFTSEKYLKAHYGQNIFELFLKNTIDSSKSSCIITDTEIIWELTKITEEIWDTLEAEIDKSTKRALRKEIIEENQKRSKEKEEKNITKKAELKRTAVREQIVIDTKRHDWIKSVKESDKEKALRELNLWEEIEEKSNNLKIMDNSKSVNLPITKKEFKKSNDISKFKSSKYKNEKYIPNKEKYIPKEPKPAEIIPLPRKCQTLSIKFTDRVFPTPSRESMAKEEEEWLTKQALARRSGDPGKKDTLPEERNPQWLKAKGDQLFKNKEYLGAISAYTEGVNISKDCVDLYISRSAVYFETGSFQKTLEDCSKALEILNPPLPVNKNMRVKCIARKAAALCELGSKENGFSEFEVALKLAANDEELKDSIKQMQQKYL